MSNLMQEWSSEGVLQTVACMSTIFKLNDISTAIVFVCDTRHISRKTLLAMTELIKYSRQNTCKRLFDNLTFRIISN